MISKLFINRPIVAMVIAIVTVIGGLVAMAGLPVAQFPEIVPPQIIVNTTYTGADAVTIEQSVATPLEQQMSGVDNMLYMQSTNANDGTMTLTVTFDVDTNPTIDQVNVQNRVAQAQPNLPADVNQFGVSMRKSTGLPTVVFSIFSPQRTHDSLFLANYANININDALYRVPGVGEVRLFGASDYAMRIWVKPDLLAKLGLTVPDLARAVQQQSTVNPAGQVGAEPAPKGKEMTYTLRAQGRLQTPEEFGQVVVRSNPDGSVVRLKDVARIELGAQNYDQISRFGGQPAGIIAVFQAPGSNALAVADGVKKTMADLKGRFPDDLDYAVSLDTTRPVTEGISEIVQTLLIAIVLVILVVFIFLQNWRATLIPMIAVPVSLIGTFAIFPLLGFSLNTLTLFALVLAIGLVVDDAIVVVEAATEIMDSRKLPAREATKAAMKEVSGPVVAIALVLISVFVPVAFLGGLTGQFYRQFALTLAVSVAISALIALTFTPALCALLLKPTAESHFGGILGRFFSAFDRGFKGFTARYVGTVGTAIRRSVRSIAIFLILTAAALWLLQARPTGFMPDEDQGYLIGLVTLPVGASLQRTEAVAGEFSAIVRKQPEIQATFAITGLNLLTGTHSSYAATIFIILKPWGQRAGAAHGSLARAARVNKLASGGKEANVLALNPPPVPGIGAAGGFEFILEDRSGGDIQKFAGVIQDFLGQANKRTELTRVFTQFNVRTPQIEYVLDRERAKTLGVSISSIFGTLQTFFGGNYINDFNLFGRTYKVTAQAEAAARASPESVDGLYVRSDQGDMVPLSTLVSIKEIQGPEYIE